MNPTSVSAVTNVKSRTIAIFSILLAGIGMAFSQMGETPAPPEIKRDEHSMDVVSRAFVEQERHFQENDKGPVLQWIERTRLEGKLDGHCVVLVKEKGSNADPIIPEMAAFLRSSGYQVSTDSAIATLPKQLLGLRFEAQRNCVMVHIGIL